MIEVKQAALADLVTVSSILKEAAGWLRVTGRAMWRDDEPQVRLKKARRREGAAEQKLCQERGYAMCYR